MHLGKFGVQINWILKSNTGHWLSTATGKCRSAGPVKCGSHSNISGGSVYARHVTAADGWLRGHTSCFHPQYFRQ